ncbi:MAG: gliding motility-associated C-terminal domain-containing protein [Salinivirgaceae bacterium]|nr:gliding motility-associated C-terminal domain-containing protein [Salinivirgaceae bacterium]
MKLLIEKTIILIVFVTLSIGVFSQITINDDHQVDSTEYLNEYLQKDAIYIFYYPDDYGNPINPKLEAKINSMPDSLLNFTWKYFNESTFAFDSIIKNFSGVNSSIIDTVNSGGYRVEITNGEITKGKVDTSFTIWFNKQLLRLKDEVELVESTCEDLKLEAIVEFKDTFTYYNPDILDNEAYYIVNRLDYLWTLNEDTLLQNKREVTITKPPTEASRYWVEIKDIYNVTKRAPFDIDEESVENNQKVLRAVKADFSAESLSNKAEGDTIRIEAPRGVMFLNESSETGELFNWYFHNNIKWTKDYGEKYFQTSDLDELNDSVYYENLPFVEDVDTIGYNVTLKAYGPVYYSTANEDFRCMDSITKSSFVIVESSYLPENNRDNLLEMPNVFTPFDGGENDYYYFQKDKKPISIKYFSIKIYNRWGNKIYQYEDEDGSWHEDGKSESGWDGMTRFGGKVKPGVYYYYAKAIGWDDEPFDSYGFFHVFYKK